MKLSLIILILAYVTIGALTKNTEKKLFNNWKLKFKKNYGSEARELKAKLNFKHWDVKIKSHNAAHARGKTTFTMAHNRFSDMSQEDFSKRLTMHKVKKLPTKKATPTWTVPSDWKAGSLNLTTPEIPVKDQGQCGSCWAFSASGVLEYYFWNTYNYYYKLSEQNFVDCARENGCEGGWMHECFDYAKANGIDYDYWYPYKGKLQECSYKDTIASDGTGIAYYYTPEWYTVPADEKSLAYAIQQFGWVSVCLNATSFQFYSKGIIPASECTKGPNHAVVAVGYGTDTKTSMDYWIIRNSWGSWWGEQGYVRLERGKNACDIAHEYEYYRIHLAAET